MLALLALSGALITQSLAAGLAIEQWLHKGQGGFLRRCWLALAIGALLLALQQGYALELALRTGLHDLRQAVLGALAAIMLALAVYGLKRPQS